MGGRGKKEGAPALRGGGKEMKKIIAEKMNKHCLSLLKSTILVVGAIVIVTIVANLMLAKSNYEIVGYETYTVSYGDTLWNIAEDIQKDQNIQMDIREIEYDIKTMNEWNGNSIVYCGDIISTPVYEEY